MTTTTPELGQLEDLDITPPCETKTHRWSTPAEFVVRMTMPCDCNFVALWCSGCVATLNMLGCWHCKSKHHNVGRAIYWCRIESLRP